MDISLSSAWMIRYIMLQMIMTNMSLMQISLCLSTLMLTGAATPYIHNGEVDGKVGITGRNDIGFLIWEKDSESTAGLGLGSRFKTPLLLVWVTLVNGSWGVSVQP